MLTRGLSTYFAACFTTCLSALLCWGFLAAGSARAETPVVRIAVLKFGTVNWLMETVKTGGFDAAEGFDLEVIGLAGKPATDIAFQSGDADLLVTDWVWALGQRAKGRKLFFSPYLNASGALVARQGMTDLCALRGRKVGVVGGAQDKSWLVLQALAERDCGFDLAAETEALFGAPPLMSRQLTDGAVDAVSTYWHFVAKLEAAGMTPVIRISDALAELGIAPAPPLIGFVWDSDRMDSTLAEAFLRATSGAAQVLAEDDGAWEKLRPLMRVKTDAEFDGLKSAYRRGIPKAWTAADTQSAQQLYELLIARAGKAFTDRAGPFDPAVFHNR